MLIAFARQCCLFPPWTELLRGYYYQVRYHASHHVLVTFSQSYKLQICETQVLRSQTFFDWFLATRRQFFRSHLHMRFPVQ